MKAVLSEDSKDSLSSSIHDFVNTIPVNAGSFTNVQCGKLEKKERVPMKSAPEYKLSDSHPTPYTAPWVMRRLKEDKPEQAVAHLKIWMSEKRHSEANEETVRLLLALDDEEAIEAIGRLKGPKKYVKGSKGYQLDLPVLLQTVDTGRQFKVTGLLNNTVSVFPNSLYPLNEIFSQ